MTTKSTRKHRVFSSPSSPHIGPLSQVMTCVDTPLPCAQRFTLAVTHSVGFDKCVMTRVLTTAPCKVVIVSLPRTPPLWAPSSHSPPPSTQQPLIFFLSPQNWPFPECHAVGIVQCVGFSYWLLSLSSNRHLRLPHVFPLENKMATTPLFLPGKFHEQRS